jgi:hypothetical protein
VSNRVSETILLCEDDCHERLVRRYLEKCGLRTQPPSLIVKNASRVVHGGNVGWVLAEFAKELEACRRRHQTHASTLLIVVIDADDHSVVEREAHLNSKRQTDGADPLVVLIPKRHIETWIRSALGEAVNENDSYKIPEPTKAEFRAAANQIHGWARGNPAPAVTCVDSLRRSLPNWRRIG